MSRGRAVSVQMVALGDVLPNPYRQTTQYAIDEDKITALIQSYDNSGFWDGSIQGRPSPDERGKIEIAFGHHRVEAARRKPIDPIGIVVADRSNADMLRMMADENRDEFKHDAWIGTETIAAVIEAFDRGEIELEAVAAGRNEKPFNLPSGKLYSLATVARFLGWVKPSDGQATNACRVAFDGYRERAATEDALRRLTPTERSEVAVDTVNIAVRAAGAAAVHAGLSPSKVREAKRRAADQTVKEIQDTSGFKARTTAVDIGKTAAREVAGPKTKKVPQIEVYTGRLIAKCEKVEPYAEILTECYRLVPFIDDLDEPLARRLAKALDAMLKRSTVGVEGIVKALRAGNRKRFVALLEEKGA